MFSRKQEHYESLILLQPRSNIHCIHLFLNTSNKTLHTCEKHLIVFDLSFQWQINFFNLKVFVKHVIFYKCKHIICILYLQWQLESLGGGVPKSLKVTHAFLVANQRQESQWRKPTQITSAWSGRNREWRHFAAASSRIAQERVWETWRTRSHARSALQSDENTPSTHLTSWRDPKQTEDDDRVSFTGVLLHRASPWPRPESK